jgi:hypothetical protein
MTKTVLLPNGEKGIIGSPAHRLLQRLAADPLGYVVRGAGATDTQLLSLAKDYRVKLHKSREGMRVVIEGAYLTPAGRTYVEMLDAAEARELMLATL